MLSTLCPMALFSSGSVWRHGTASTVASAWGLQRTHEDASPQLVLMKFSLKTRRKKKILTFPLAVSLQRLFEDTRESLRWLDKHDEGLCVGIITGDWARQVWELLLVPFTLFLESFCGVFCS